MKRTTLIKCALLALVGLSAPVLKAEISLPVGYVQLEWMKSTMRTVADLLASAPGK